MFWGGINGDDFFDPWSDECDGDAGFVTDPNFYHKPLETLLSEPRIERETKLAVLFTGTHYRKPVQMWVPKKLLRKLKRGGYLVWENFSPTYMPVEDPLADFDKLD